ncbi:CGNR zinc finger domain-containing protein [Actinomycetospora sp. TBRC 11914]|uniref:CGNR zinc finger domain-containing protein n=1 Tax=Actinomycetospora sp. TBRC 11914 TaxID=2729387 RepID=UPI00145F56BD|nr:CGNR zinc finger domain-containing protein [Actinomycetospora sp. TBRC 11914]NMO89782.1 CGNR zinc finger domain-containing protein [Actinomycetospora sp. TBRC 11914]
MDWGPEAFVAGHVALDFTNTVGGFRRERVERLVTYADLVAWAAAADVVDDAEAAALSDLAAADPEAADRALADVHAQREALYRWLAAAVRGEAAEEEADRARVTDDVVAAHRAARPAPDPTRGPAWPVTVDDAGLALPGRRLALATGALLAGEERRRIGRCGRCSWLFLDPSPSRRRRWCSMATCGNRAKAARHHARASDG